MKATKIFFISYIFIILFVILYEKDENPDELLTVHACFGVEDEEYFNPFLKIIGDISSEKLIFKKYRTKGFYENEVVGAFI